MTCHAARYTRVPRDTEHDDLTFYDAPEGTVHCRSCGGDFTIEALWRVPCPAKAEGTPF